jgi:hypothetical protein
MSRGRKSRRTARVDWDAELEAARANGETQRQLVQRLKVPQSTAHREIHRRGVKLKKGVRGLGDRWPLELKEARRRGECQTELAQRLGVALQSVWRAVRRHKIMLRDGRKP